MAAGLALIKETPLLINSLSGFCLDAERKSGDGTRPYLAGFLTSHKARPHDPGNASPLTAGFLALLIS